MSAEHGALSGSRLLGTIAGVLVSQTLEALRCAPVLAGLDDTEIGELASVAVPRSFAAGEVVFRQGDPGDTCYLVQAGLVRAIHAHSDGRWIALAQLGPGELFGELAAFDDEPRAATADVLKDADTVAILAADMRRLIAAHPALAANLIRSLAQRLRATNDRLARRSFQTVSSRVAGVLAQLASAACATDESDAGVVIESTQADLARLAGSSRESASRFLAMLERARVITQRRGQLTVHDRAALERYVY